MAAQRPGRALGAGGEALGGPRRQRQGPRRHGRLHQAQAGGAFSCYSFAVNPATTSCGLPRTVLTHKEPPSDFPVEVHKTYQLTLTSAGDEELRGYVDGNNLISLSTGASPAFRAAAPGCSLTA